MNNTPPAPKKRRIWRVLITLVVILCILALAGYGALKVYIRSQLPDVSRLKDIHLQVPMRILDRDGQLIAQYGEKRRIPLTFEEIPKQLVDAVLSTEDARFYEHPGVDLIGLARAAVVMIKSGRKEQGASTITMQVARNFYLTRKKTFSRKIQEILLALKIDSELPKDKILSLYLNKIFFGNRAYGVGAASAVYYGKQLNELTLAQLAMLAGLPQSPSRNNPIRNPEGAIERRNHVLERMLELKEITQEQFQTAVIQPVTATYHQKKIGLYAPYVANKVRDNMFAKLGDRIYEIGLQVTTTLQADLQRAAHNALQKGLIAYSLRHGYWGPEGHVDAALIDRTNLDGVFKPYDKLPILPLALVLGVDTDSITVIRPDQSTLTIPWSGLKWARRHLADQTVSPYPRTADEIVRIGDIVRVQDHAGHPRLAQWPKVQGALVATNPKTGAVLAMTGGFSYKRSEFNRVTQALRQPGSCFKPFIYSAALNKGFTFATIINDAPVVKQDSGENALWRPMNDTKKFYGPTTLHTGLIKSRNMVSIRLLEKTGVPYTLNYLQRFGFNPQKMAHSLSLALGSAEVTPYDLIRSYDVFANGGYLLPNQLIASTRYSGSEPTASTFPIRCPSTPQMNNNSDEPPCQPPFITPQNDYLMVRALQDVIQHGTGRGARVLKRDDLSGKTGTTNKQVDAWFAGFNQSIAVVVWVGFDDLASLHEYGSQAALPIWVDFMRQALAHTPVESLQEPSGMVTMRINRLTGEPTTASGPQTRFETFRKEYAPTVQTDQSQAQSTEPTEQTDTADQADDDIF